MHNNQSGESPWSTTRDRRYVSVMYDREWRTERHGSSLMDKAELKLIFFKRTLNKNVKDVINKSVKIKM